MTAILAAYTELDAAFRDLSGGYQLAVILIVAALITPVAYGLCVTFGIVMARVLRTVREERVPVPAPDPFHNTYCRSCEAWKYTDATACQSVGDDGVVCETPLQIYPDDPIAFAEAMAEVYPLPTPRSFASPAAKGFDRGRPAILDGHRDTPHAKLIQMYRKVN